jgi:hypothetical protein
MKTLKTHEDLYNFARDNGLPKTKSLLRLYVKLGQPDCFMPGWTSRAMCRTASMGLERKNINLLVQYIYTEFGPDLYCYMWTGHDLGYWE